MPEAEYRDATVFIAWPAADYSPDQASLTARLRQIAGPDNPARFERRGRVFPGAMLPKRNIPRFPPPARRRDPSG